MKLLIICDMFPPAFAPRMGYLCKYLRKAGWEPVVVTEQIDEDMYSFLTGYAEVTYVTYYRAKNRFLKRLEWTAIQLLDFFFNYKEKKMLKVVKGIVEKNQFVGVLCNVYRTFPLPVAQKIAEKYHLPFVADTRDIIEQYASNEYIAHPIQLLPCIDRQITSLLTKRWLKKRNKVLRKANCVTTVSPWHVEIMRQYNSNVWLIYNGYDPELFYPETIKTSEFRIVYTGRLVSLATRDPRVLFQAIQELADEQLIKTADFRVQWFMDKASWDTILPLIDEYGIADYMDYKGYVSADDIPRILNNSSVLLQLANKADENGPKGIMSTKLFEAFAVEKPVLCTRSDESFLEAIIDEAHAGASARTTQEAKDFLLNYYKEWKEKGYTSVNVNHEVVESFSREKQAEQFRQLFMELKDQVQ
jgi:glycosyltransferase involved in cell wall biosynthesis